MAGQSEGWDRDAATAPDAPLSDNQKTELDRRLKSFETDSAKARSWSEVFHSLRNRRH